MKYIKKSLILLVLFFTIYLITSCSEEIRKNETFKPNNETSAHDPSLTDDSRYEAVFNNNLIIDASVYNPQINTVPVLISKYREFDHETVCNMFLKDEYSKTFEYDDYTEYSDGDGAVYFRKGSFEYGTEFADYINSLFGINSRKNFRKNINLDFMTIEDAIKLCTEKLKALSIDVFLPAEVYSLDYESLQKEQNIKIQDEDFMFYVEKGKIKLKDKWEKKDDAYYIMFRTLRNGLIFDPEGYIIQDADRMIEGNYISMIVSREGIKECKIHGVIYEDTGTEKNDSNLIPFEESLNLLKKKYDNIILQNKITVNEIFLSYVPVPVSSNKNEYKLYPSWTYKMQEFISTTDGDIVIDKYVRFNAITGEEIL